AAGGNVPEEVVAADRTDRGRRDDQKERDRRDASRHSSEYKTLRPRDALRRGWWGGWGRGRRRQPVVDGDVAIHGADLQRIFAAVDFARHASRSGVRVNVQRERRLEVAVDLCEVAVERGARREHRQDAAVDRAEPRAVEIGEELCFDPPVDAL